MTATLHAQLVERVREVARERTDEDTHLAVCPAGDHLRAARRVQSSCPRCGQSIATGNVGPATWDDDYTCGKGFWNHQHGCGEWNSPVEVTIRLDEITVDDDDDPEIMAYDVIDDVIAKLDDACKQAIADEVARARVALARLIVEARAALDKHIAEHGPLPAVPDEDDPSYHEVLDERYEILELISLRHGAEILDEARTLGEDWASTFDHESKAVLLQTDNTLIGWDYQHDEPIELDEQTAGQILQEANQ